MRRPPLLREAHRYPVVSGLGVAAATATVAWWYGWNIEPFVMDARFWPREPWRLVTSTLPHANIFHLAFNLYWLWVFGTLVEEAYGHISTLLILIMFAAGSSAAEFAVLHGGVGLSGVGYGLFGLLWALKRRDARFFDAVDRSTIKLFVFWFFLCIVLTVTKYMPVANFAHGSGAILGALLGLAVAGRSYRLMLRGALAVLVALFVLGAGPGRPYVNLAGGGARDLERKGVIALKKGENQEAAELLRRAAALNPLDASIWYNLGIACQRLEQTEEAAGAFDVACALNPVEPELRTGLCQWKGHQAWQAQAESRWADAVRLYQEALNFDRKNATVWRNLAVCYEQMGRVADAVKAQEHVVQLDRSPQAREELERLRALKPAP